MKTKLFVVMAGLAMCVASTAQADVAIAINNGSFEEGTASRTATVDGGIAGKGIGYTTFNVVEHFDIGTNQVPGGVSGNLNGASGQPTGHNGRPKDWTYTGNIVQDNIATDARWNGVWNGYQAGPTDGFTAIILDNRSGQATNNTAAEIFMKQTLSQNVGDLKALGSSLRMDFDARYGEGGQNALGIGHAQDFIKVYFEVNGVQDVAGTWETNFLAAGPGGRLVRNFAEINGALAQPFYGNVAPTRSTDYFAPNSTIGAQNMDTFSAYLDLSGYDDAHSVTMVIHNARFKIDNVNSGSNRVYMDNVRVFAEAAVIPEPASGVTLLIGAAGLLLKRRRRA
jgi:hypothetical protein